MTDSRLEYAASRTKIFDFRSVFILEILKISSNFLAAGMPCPKEEGTGAPKAGTGAVSRSEEEDAGAPKVEAVSRSKEEGSGIAGTGAVARSKEEAARSANFGTGAVGKCQAVVGRREDPELPPPAGDLASIPPVAVGVNATDEDPKRTMVAGAGGPPNDGAKGVGSSARSPPAAAGTGGAPKAAGSTFLLGAVVSGSIETGLEIFETSCLASLAFLNSMSFCL